MTARVWVFAALLVLIPSCWPAVAATPGANSNGSHTPQRDVSPPPQRDEDNTSGRSSQGRPSDQGHQGEGDQFAAAAFVGGNVRFVLYHEFAHALIHLFDLPVLGQEEDAADTLAALLSLPTKMKTEHDRGEGRMTIAVTNAFLFSNELDRKAGIKPAFWDSHGLDIQRAYHILCLIYGSHPEHFAFMADAAKLTEIRRKQCVGEYRQASRSWSSVMTGIARKESQPVHHFIINYQPASPRNAELEREAQMIPILLGRMDEFFALPKDIPVDVKSCGQANAFYDPETGRMTVCYELFEFFNQLVLYSQHN